MKAIKSMLGRGRGHGGFKTAYDVFHQGKLKKLVRPGPRRQAGVTFTTDWVQVHINVVHDYRGMKYALHKLLAGDCRLIASDDIEVVGVDPGRRDVVTTCNLSVPIGTPGRHWRCAHSTIDPRPRTLDPAPCTRCCIRCC